MLTTCKAAYEMLGVYLGVGRDKIKEIQKMSGPGDCVLCMSEMLDIYLREKHFDLEEVCNALEKVDRKGLSEKFRKKYEGKMFFCDGDPHTPFLNSWVKILHVHALVCL